MIFRSLDENHDWTFGAGVQNYAAGLDALILDLKTRLLSWVGDCFFDTQAGIDWKNRLEYGQQKKLTNDIKTVAMQTNGILAVDVVSFVVDASRRATIKLSIDTIYGTGIITESTMSMGV